MRRMFTKEEIKGDGAGVVTHHITLTFDDGSDIIETKFDVVNGNAEPFTDSDTTNLLTITKPVVCTVNGDVKFGIAYYFPSAATAYYISVQKHNDSSDVVNRQLSLDNTTLLDEIE